MCFFVIELTPDEARVLDYPLEKFRRFFNHFKSTPKWDGHFVTTGLFREG
jgi:hypothetical protein